MKIIKSVLGVLATVAALSGWAKNEKGSCISNPLSMSVGQTMNVTLVDEYDTELKENFGLGVAYIKISLAKGNAYTIWCTGGDTAELLSFSVDTNFDDENAPLASFDYDTKSDGATQIAYMYADEWFEDDPAKGTYYIMLMGDIGQRTTVSFVSGIRSFSVEGEEGNPRRFTVTEDIQRESRKQVSDGDFYYVMRLQAGRKYRFWAIGTDEPIVIYPDGPGEILASADKQYDVYFQSQFPGYDKAKGLGYVIFPSADGDYTFNIGTRSSLSQNFAILVQAFKQRPPAEHRTADEWPKYTFANDGTGESKLKVVPGRINTDDVYYYDPVIDEDLCRVALKKGERVVFETEGSTNLVLLRIYDMNGTILAENDGLGNKSREVRAAVEAAYDGWYYVGVCDPMLEYDMAGRKEEVTLLMRSTDFYSGSWDQWDPTDDTYPGATIIDAYPAASTNDVVEFGSVSGPHRLGGGDWQDWFCFAGRKFVNYRLKASFAGDETTDLYLAATVYKMVNGAYSVVATTGGLSPWEVNPDLGALSFTADEDAMYYVCASVAVKVGEKLVPAVGLDYPDYNLHATCYLDGYDFALVRVNTMGAEGTWRFEDLVTGESKVSMKNGASIALIVDPTGRNSQRNVFRIWYDDVPGYTKPKEVLRYGTKAWDGKEVVEIDGYYWDSFDPKDDSFGSGGYALIDPVAEAQTASRTLWVGRQFAGTEVVGTDVEDEFAFLAQAGRYYNFTLADFTSALTGGALEEGDAVFSIYKYPDLDKPYNSLTNLIQCQKQVFDAGSYYLVRVNHGSTPKGERDSCYEFIYDSVNVGTVQFAPAKVTVTKDDCYAELKVTRSAAEGKVSVRYATVADTAKPHEDYYPTSSEQVLTWENGDSSTKTIRIRLVPDLVPEWSKSKKFKVVMAPLPDDAMGVAEYRAIIAGSDTAEVTIATSVPASAGEIAVENQLSEIAAGDGSFAFRLTRSGGCQGKVAIAVASNPGTAAAGTDYKNLTYTVVEWADGEGGTKEVPFTTYDTGATSAKTVNMSLLAVNADYRSSGYGDYRGCVIPTVRTPSWVATIRGQVARNTGDFVAACSRQGVGIQTPIGGWMVDASGVLRNVTAGSTVRIGFTFREAGFLTLAPDVVGDSASVSVIYLVGNGTVMTLPRSDYGKPLVLTVPAGGATVLMQINGEGAKGSYLSLGMLDNGLPIKWVPLSSVKAVSPLSGAVELQDQVGRLEWSEPLSAEGKAVGGDVWYRVKLGLSADATVYDGVAEGLNTSGMIAEDMLKTLNSMVDKLSLGKGQQFWWRVECAYSEEVSPDFKSLTWIPVPEAWGFKMLFKGSPTTVVSGMDAKGSALTPGQVVELVQGVPFDAALTASEYDNLLDISACVGGRLPRGLVATGKRISGVPSEVGEFQALVEVGSSAYLATTVPLTIRVSPMHSAAGSFSGALQEVGTATPHATFRNLGLNVTVTEAGAITAKVLYNGGALTFTGSNGYEGYDPATGLFSVTLNNVVTCAGFENRLTLSAWGVDPEDEASLTNGLASADFTLFLSDGKSPTERQYHAVLTRDGSGGGLFRERIRDFVGSYTFALKPFGPCAGEPGGNSVLVMTLAESGTAAITGILADGRSFTCSSYADVTSVDGGGAVCVPVWAFGADYSFSALLVLRDGGDDADGERVIYVDSHSGVDGSAVTWTKDGAGSTYDGTGFRLEMSPVGGWYDTIVNLQRYYLEYDFKAETEPVTGLASYLLPSGYSYIAGSTPSGLTVAMDGNALTVPPLSFVMDGPRIDLERSTNPWGMTLTFNRGLGYMTGTFNVISDDRVTQKYAGTATHHSVLLMNRDPKSPIDEDALTAGFYVLPVKGAWSLSQPFGLKAIGGNGYVDWSEPTMQK